MFRELLSTAVHPASSEYAVAAAILDQKAGHARSTASPEATSAIRKSRREPVVTALGRGANERDGCSPGTVVIAPVLTSGIGRA